MRWTRTICVLAVAALAGCASKAPSSVLAGGPRMIDIYRGTPAGQEELTRPDDGGASEREMGCRWWLFTWPCERPDPKTEATEGPVGAGETVTYTRTAANELELLFPRLPNPDIYIHVLPHLATAARVPVPGYTTAVPLYERVEYALPGELDYAMRLLAAGAGREGAEADASSAGGDSDGGKNAPGEREESP